MPAPNPPASRSRTPLVSSWLWVLAAVFGITTIYNGASIIHDTSRRREAVQTVSQSMAEHVVAMAAGRTEVLALSEFAPVARPDAAGDPGGSAALASLVVAHNEAEACRCRAVIPVRAFVRVGLASGRVDVQRIGDAGAPLPSDSVLLAVAREEATRSVEAQVAPVHARIEGALGPHALLTYVARNRTGGPVAVYGAIAPRDSLLRLLFGYAAIEGPARGGHLALAHLDTMSLRVSTADSAGVFGTISVDHRFRSTVDAPGALTGMSVTVALRGGQIPVPLMVLPHESLSHLGLLMIGTIVVLVVAVRASRRELMLARARSDFIAGVSHELRMPLAQILLASETLALSRDRDAGERASLANSIVREARRLKSLVDNVLLVSRSARVELKANLAPTPVASLFADTIDAVDLAVKDAGQTIEAKPTEVADVLADRDLVRQALVNLVDNAMKYGRAGQRIALAAARGAPGCVRIFVDDAGPGIPKPERERLFNAYERLGRDQASERTGTGLGLAVVSQIARACGGRAWLDDAPGGGTRAVIELKAASPS